MKKNNVFPLIITLAIILIVGLFVFLIKNKNASPPESTPIFFYGYNCQYCQNVEEFFIANQITEKVFFEQREVYKSSANAKILNDRYNKCGIIDPKQMGVPLYWDGTTCISGDQPIIDYFKNKLGL